MLDFYDTSILVKQQYLYIATVCQAMLSFILAKSLFGRLYTCTYCVLFLVTILDILERWLISDNDITDKAKVVFLLRSTLVYILYFSICQFGVLVLAKTE